MKPDFFTACEGEFEQRFIGKLSTIEADKYFIITDENCSAYCLDFLKFLVRKYHCKTILCKSGENNKTLSQCEHIWSNLMRWQCGRKSLIFIVGGGMVCDMGSFAASTFMRGVRHILVPTTLLAQTDAAIGGKTAINFQNIKNQIGTFSEPVFTAINTSFLKTLDKREILSGMSEIVKHGLIFDKSIISDLKSQDVEKLSGDGAFAKILHKSIEVKSHFVEQDLHDNNIRKVLNFGHTIGHAVESALLNVVTHGEAVAFGMVSSLLLSKNHCRLNPVSFVTALIAIERNTNIAIFKTLFDSQNVDDTAQEITDIALHDKKNENSAMKFVLLQNLGEVVVDVEIDKADVYEAIIQTIAIIKKL